jgi:hypothetical protein
LSFDSKTAPRPVIEGQPRHGGNRDLVPHPNRESQPPGQGFARLHGGLVAARGWRRPWRDHVRQTEDGCDLDTLRGGGAEA